MTHDTYIIHAPTLENLMEQGIVPVDGSIAAYCQICGATLVIGPKAQAHAAQGIPAYRCMAHLPQDDSWEVIL